MEETKMAKKETVLFTKSHEWVEVIDENTIRAGLTDYAQESLGDLVFINLPEPGDEVIMQEPFGDVESVKAVSDIFSPVTGIVSAINEELLDVPELINQSPYDAWLVEINEITEREDYLTLKEYEELIRGEE